MFATWLPDQENPFDSEDEEESTFDIKGREAIIFVLDAMLFKSSTTFQEAVNLIRDALLSGLIVNDKDLIGIVFANTQKSPAPKDSVALKNIVVPPNCAVFLPLRQLNKDIVEYYLNFTEENYFDFEATYGVSDGKFANMIRLCGNMFQQCGMKLSNQTIVYFTDRENPHESGTQEFQKAIQRATDMEGQNIEFSLIPMRDDFNFEPFYKEFLCLVKDIEMESFESIDPKLAREMIADRKLKLDINKRCLGSVNWSLGDSLQVSVKFYNYFQKSVYPKKVNLRREDNSIVTVKIENTIIEKDPESAQFIEERELRSDDVVYRLKCGNEVVEVPEKEMLNVSYPYQPVLQLIGFKDRSELNKLHYLRPCSFIYPDENRISGSTKLFAALWQRCLEKEKIAVCIFIPRKKSRPTYVALLPVSSHTDDITVPANISGDGFKVVYLPLAVDMKNPDLKDWGVTVSPSESGREFFGNVIKKLKVKYIPSKIKDPTLEELQSKLLALALNITTEGGGDVQMPNGEKQDKRIKQYLLEIENIFGVEEVAVKRKAAVSPLKASQAKVAKNSNPDLSASEIDDLIAAGKLENLNKQQLMNFLRLNKVCVNASMTKKILIEKVLELQSSIP